MVLLDRELARIEAIETAILSELGHSSDGGVFRTKDLNVVLDRISDEHQLRADRKSQKAYCAVLALLHLKQLRVDIWGDDAARAASAALRVGIYGGGVLLQAIDGAKRDAARSKGGRARARQRAEQRQPEWKEWQAATDRLNRAHSKAGAAVLVAAEMSEQGKAANPDTIRKRITLKKKLAHS